LSNLRLRSLRSLSQVLYSCVTASNLADMVSTQAPANVGELTVLLASRRLHLQAASLSHRKVPATFIATKRATSPVSSAATREGGLMRADPTHPRLWPFPSYRCSAGLRFLLRHRPPEVRVAARRAACLGNPWRGVRGWPAVNSSRTLTSGPRFTRRPGNDTSRTRIVTDRMQWVRHALTRSSAD